MAQGKEHKPTKETRQTVKDGASWGIKQDIIAKKLDISKDTLIKHYRKELDEGIAKTHFEVGQTLAERAKTDTTMGIFFAKTQMGWSEKVIHEIEMPETVLNIMKRGND